VYYRQKPGDPENLIQHFGGVVRTGLVEPQPDMPKPRIRDFRYPEDLGVFFHSWCAPRVKLPQKVQEEISELLAQALIAHYEKCVTRWTGVRQSLPRKGDALRMHAHVASSEGRRVFTMTRSEWAQFRAHPGELIEIDLERTPTGGVAQSASTIASLAQRYHDQTEQIEVWRYNEQDPPQFLNLNIYLVLENLTRRLNLGMFADCASTQDSPRLRKYLRDHVFLVKERPDKGRWEAKARAVERIVFMAI